MGIPRGLGMRRIRAGAPCEQTPLPPMPSFSSASSRARGRLLAVALLALVAGGCKTAQEQRADADRQTYEILEQRRQELALGEVEFTIEPPADSLRQRLLRGETIGPAGITETLEIAAENSRDFQRRKEDLYIAALDLTLERFRFDVQQNGRIGALLNGDADGATTLSESFSAGFTKLLGTGAVVVADMGLALTRSVTTGDSWDIVSAPVLSVTQPLMRGFGERIVREPLTQAERNVVYKLREYERFRRTFCVDAITRYIQLLRAADQVKNERTNMDNLVALRERNEALAEAGRQSDIQTDQARQNELASRNRLIQAIERYGTALDDLKLFLGLPIEIQFEPVSSELYDMTIDDTLTIEDKLAVEVGLRLRLDYMTVLDQLEDSERKVNVAADALRTRFDVAGSVRATSTDGSPVEFSRDDLAWTLRPDIVFPLAIVAERNAYRKAFITMERARRSAEQLGDEITSGVRASVRQARTRRQSVDIQANAVTLAERRIESANLSLQAGRATTRDILEAQQALVDARNALTGARVDYYLSQLALWRDMELLRVDENGLRFAREGLSVAPDAAPAPQVPNNESAGESGAQETQ